MNCQRARSLPSVLVLAVFILVMAFLLASCDRPRLDKQLCPRDHPVLRTTVLLLDTSDPLTEKHEEELKRIVRKLQSPAESADGFPVAPGEALVVYELTPRLRELKPVIKVCNPGKHPENWGWLDKLTRGKKIALGQWYRFHEAVRPLFEKSMRLTAQPRSPIIETLGVLVPRYASSTYSRNGMQDRPTHIIVFSDLLQHSDALSHYGPYPPASKIPKTAGLRAIQTDLRGVEVSLYRLERPLPTGKWQTRDHYYWWTELVRVFGGELIYQDSI